MDLFHELLWFFLCSFLTHLGCLGSSLYLYYILFLIFFLDYQNILLSWLQCTVSVHSKLLCTWPPKQFLIPAWRWDHGIQWFNPPLALHSSNQMNLPLLLEGLQQFELDLPVWSDAVLFLGLLVSYLPMLHSLSLHTHLSPSPPPQLSPIYVSNIFQMFFSNLISPFL